MADYVETTSGGGESNGEAIFYQDFNVQQSFLFNSGGSLYWWYHVEARGQAAGVGAGGEPERDEDWVLKLIIARNLDEVCQQLGAKNTDIKEIVKILRYTKPFATGESGPDDEYVVVYPGTVLPASCDEHVGGLSFWKGAAGKLTAANVDVEFEEPEEEPAVTEDDATITTLCECGVIPLVISMAHNLDTAGMLYGFLSRNNLTLPTQLEMKYNVLHNSWQTNIHFNGVGEDDVTQEMWSLVFEWACTDKVAAVDAGENIWKFSMYAKRQLGDGQDFDTRVLITFIPIEVCSGEVNLNFNFSLNTITRDIVEISSVSSFTATLNLLFDNIGLFKSLVWFRDPNLKIEIRQTARESTREQYDISRIIPPEGILIEQPENP
jgi:hypothetical protein